MKKNKGKKVKKPSKNSKVKHKQAASKKSAAAPKGKLSKVLAKVASKSMSFVKGKAAEKGKKPLAKAAKVPVKAAKEKAVKRIKQAAPSAAPEVTPVPEQEVVLTNADGKQYCKSPDCDESATSMGYCRLHYLTFWKRNKVKTKILEGEKLDKYIEELTSKYPDKYMEMLRKDLASEKDFNLIVAEMDVEDSNEENEAEEETSRYIEEVRGGIGGHTSGDEDEGF